MESGGRGTARARIEWVVICGVFAVYVAFLAKLLVFSRVSLQDLAQGRAAAARAVNLVPFGSILAYARGGTEAVRRFAFSNVAGNLIAFVPLGAFLPLLRRDRRIRWNLLLVFGASLLAEVVQGAFALGTADIDDLILNCAGGLVGILGYRLLLRVLGREARARTAVAVLAALGLPVLLYLMFGIKLRL